MTTISDLSDDVVVEILYRVPMTSLRSVRSTCKKWNTLSMYMVLCKRVAKKQFLGFMMMNSRICSLRFGLQRNRNDGYFADPYIKQISILEVSKVLHCDGLLLCVAMGNSTLVVWNSYLGQTRWIRPRDGFHRFDKFAFGYNEDNHNHNYKILRSVDDYLNLGNHVFEYEIYYFSSNLWRVLDIIQDWDIQFYVKDVTLKGNAYFFAQEEMTDDGVIEAYLLCFDFTRERFGPRLPVPFQIFDEETVALSCVREEQLAVLYQCMDLVETIEIWVTTKIEPNTVSWSKFLKVDTRALTGFRFEVEVGSFFIDEEEKVVVVFDANKLKQTETCRYQIANFIGEDGYFKSVSFGEDLVLGYPDKLCNGYVYCYPFVCTSYVPSLVQP